MKEPKIRVLGIAPNQNLRNQMVNVASLFKNIDLTVYVGNLDAGVQLARQHMFENYDIIISRGKTATLIKTFSTLPVVEIPLTAYDILRTIKLIQQSDTKYALVCFTNTATPIRVSCELLNFNLNIVTVEEENKVEPAIKKLIKDGYSLVLFDTIMDIIARKLGTNPVLIVSGSESIEQAFNEAITITNSHKALKTTNFILEESLKSHTSKTVILSESGDVIFTTYSEENIHTVLEYLRKLINATKKPVKSKSFHQIDNSLYSLNIEVIKFNNTKCFSFGIEPNPIPSGSNRHGIRHANNIDMLDIYNSSFYSLTSSALLLKDKINSLSKCHMPIMLLGEEGTGKTPVAAKIFLESEYVNYPYIIIECALLDDKGWNFITSHINSPLFDKNNTLYFSDIHVLPEVKQLKLLSIFLDTNTHKRNQIILSSTIGDGVDFKAIKNFIDLLPCTTVNLPPLRELLDDIKSSVNIYLNSLNFELAKQIIGFDNDATELLIKYNWPGNFVQLKRILTELVSMSETPYINYTDVKNILDNENKNTALASNVNIVNSDFDYSRPLNDMIIDIIRIVMTECNGNQTQAAKQLNIGRTTLWRYLNASDI